MRRAIFFAARSGGGSSRAPRRRGNSDPEWQRYSQLLDDCDLTTAVRVGERLFTAPKRSTTARRALTELAKLEATSEAVRSFDVLSLYERTVKHDGRHEEDINQSGTYYAYFYFELRGQNPEKRREQLLEALAGALQGRTATLSAEELAEFVPAAVDGRQITESLHIRPEDEDYPANYSPSRTAYAERMAADEVPQQILDGLRDRQDQLLDSFDWYVVHAQDPAGELVEVCDDYFLIDKTSLPLVTDYAVLWRAIREQGIASFYKESIETDGEYTDDPESGIGRFFAYIQFELAGQSPTKQIETLERLLPDEAHAAHSMESLLELFPSRFAGEPVTQVLTIRPEQELYPSYFVERKIEQGRERGLRQLLYNIQAQIRQHIDTEVGATERYVVLASGKDTSAAGEAADADTGDDVEPKQARDTKAGATADAAPGKRQARGRRRGTKKTGARV